MAMALAPNVMKAKYQSIEGSDCEFSDVNYEPTTDVIFYLSWTDSDGVEHCGTLQFELYSAEAPIHVQNFQDHVEAGNYNGTVYHRIIDGFMIQSGDFEYGNGMGGYAYSWHGYCSWTTNESSRLR